MEETKSGGGAITGVIILILVAVVAWIAYSQGLFKGKEVEAPENGVKIEIGGSQNDSSDQGAY